MSKAITPHFPGSPRALAHIHGLGSPATWVDVVSTSDIPASKPGYAKGCYLQNLGASSASTAFYINVGTETSCTFQALSPSAIDLSALTATAAEINSVVTGNTATAAELTRATDVSARLVTNTTTQLTVTEALHEGRDILLDNTHTVTVTLPAAAGTGDKFNFVVLTLGTDGSKLVTVANTTDVIFGGSVAVNTPSTTLGFQTTNATTVTFNNTTTGGKIGSRIELQDVASGKFSARVLAITSGNPATPFS